jgi:hypothetical protein
MEAFVDLALLAASNLVHRSLHVVVDAALGNAAEGHKRVVMRIKQHLMRLRQIGPHEVRTAVAELEVGDLQLGADAVDLDPVLAPVELEGFAGREL